LTKEPYGRGGGLRKVGRKEPHHYRELGQGSNQLLSIPPDFHVRRRRGRRRHAVIAETFELPAEVA
jgi:hypothetical protein